MAVTEKLIVDMQADTKDYSKNMNKAVKDAKNFKDATDKSSKSNEVLEKTLQDLNNTIKLLERSISRFSSISSNAYKNYSVDVDKSTLSLSEFNNEILQNTDNISRNSESLRSVDKNVAKYAETLEETSLVVRVFQGALQVAGIAAAAFGIDRLGQNFKVYRDNVNPVINDTVKLAKSWGFAEDLLTAKMTPSLIRFSDLLWGFAGPIALVSGLFLSLDNSFLNLVGTLGLLVAGYGGSVGAFFTVLINSAADLTTAIGVELLASLDQAEMKFEKFQSTMNQFTFTIEGFGKTLGVETVGSVDKWISVLNDLRKNTTFTTEDIAKSIKFLVAEGSRFGLTTTQIEELVKRTADVASAYGENIVDTSMKMNAAFAGSSQALQNMGFAVSDAYFSYSDYFLALGKTTEQMTKQEIAATRLDLIMKETAAIAGSAANATKTLAGSTAILDRTMNDLQVSLGETSGFLTNLQSILVKNISSLVDYAKPITSIIGTLQEWLGIGLVITGFLLKQFFYLTFYTQLWVFLTNVMRTNATVQNILNIAFLKLGKTMNFSAISVVNMTTLFKNLGLLLKSVAISTFASLAVGIKVFTAYVLSATAAVFKFTLSLMSNPIFIKGAVIVGVLTVLANAIAETVNEIGFLKTIFEETGQAANEAAGNFVDAGADMAKAFGSTIMAPLKAVFKFLVDISKFILGGLVAAVLVFAASFAYINRAVRFMANGFKESKEDAEAFDAQIQEIALKLGQTSYFIRKTGTEIEKSFGGVAFGAAYGKSAEEVQAKTKKTADILEKYVKLHMVGFDQSAEKVAELGNEYDRLTLNQKKAQIALAETYKTNLDLNEKSKKIAEARIELIKAEIAVEKQRQATMNEIESQRKSMEIDILKRTGQTTKAINLEYAEKINNVIKEEQALSKIGKLRLEDQILINQNIKLAEKARKLSISEEVQKQNELILGLEKNILEIRKEAGNQNALELKNIVDKYVEKEKELNLELRKLEIQGKSNDKVKELIGLAKQANTEAGKIAVKEFELAKFKEAKTQLDELNTQIIDLTGLELDKIDEKLKKDLEALAIKREEFELSYKMANLPIPKDRLEVYKKQEAALKRIAKINTEKAPSREFEGAKKVGTNVAEGITRAFQSGTVGMIQGAMTGVGAVVDVVQGLIDFIPGILDKISNVFNSITDLPNKIVAGLSNVFDSILKFVSDFIPNIVKMIPAIFEKFTSFFEKLPEVFANLLTNLPDMLTGILDRLPEVVENFVQKFLEAIPKIAIALAKFLIMEGPRIALELAKSLAIEIPLAIIKGVLDAFKSLPGMFKNLGKGILPKPAEIAKNFALGLKAVSKNLTGVASKLFAVMDLEDGAKASGDRVAEFAKTAQTAVDAGVKKLGDSWKGLIDAWRWVYENIILPIFNGIKAVWDFVYNNIILPIFTGLKAVWDWVSNTILKPVIEGIRAVWLFVYDTIIMPFINLIGTAFQAAWAVIQVIWESMMNVIKAVWATLMVVFEAGWNAVKAIWDGMMKIFESAWNMVKGIWDTLMQLFQGKINIFEAIFQIGAQILGHVAEVFKIIWEVAGSILGGVADIFKSVFNTAKVYLEGVANIFGSVFEGAKNVFNGIIDAFKGLFEKLGQIHVAIINGLREGLSGLGGFLADMFNQMNPIALFEKIFKVDTGAFGKKGPVEEQLGIDMPFMKFAKGGVVPGMGSVPNDSKLNDRIVALLSAGEAIIPKSKMDDPAVAAIVQGILSGEIGASGYALGGSVVKSLKNLGGDLAESFQGAVEPIADVLNPAQILDNLWKSMKGLVWDKVADMFWSMLSANKFHDGGLVPGSGEMPSMLKGGEFVLNRSAASSIGVPTLNDLNAGKAPSNNTQNIELNLVINTTQPIDATMIKNKIMPVIREELKRASIDGRTTIYQSGVRTA